MCFSYACSAQPDELIQRVKYSNKILLLPSVLHQLQDNTTSSFIFINSYKYKYKFINKPRMVR